MTKNINSIHVYFGRSPDVVGGGDVEYDDPQISGELKSTSSYTTLNSFSIADDKPCDNSKNQSMDEISNIEILLPDTNQNDKNNSYNNVELNNTEQNEIVQAECEIKSVVLPNDSKPTKTSSANEQKKPKPKLSFRFRTSRPTKTSSDNEHSLSATPPELIVVQKPRERKKSVMAAIFDNLPIIPPQHVSTASINLKKKKDGDIESSAAASAPTSRSISFRLKSRRKSETPISSSSSKPPNKSSEEHTKNKLSQLDDISKIQPNIEMKKSKSMDEGTQITTNTGCVSDGPEPEVIEENNITSCLPLESPNDQDGVPKVKRKGSRRASIAAAAATARHKWEQMKNVTPSVNRMSLKSKSRKGEDTNAINEEAKLRNDGDNNNDFHVEK